MNLDINLPTTEHDYTESCEYLHIWKKQMTKTAAFETSMKWKFFSGRCSRHEQVCYNKFYLKLDILPWIPQKQFFVIKNWRLKTALFSDKGSLRGFTVVTKVHLMENIWPCSFAVLLNLLFFFWVRVSFAWNNYLTNWQHCE